MSKPFPYKRSWIGLLLTGLVNNLPYCVVLSAAKSLAKFFHQEEYLGLIVFANVGSGILIRIINTYFFNSIRYSTRIYFNTLLMITALVGMYFVERFNFFFLLGCIILLGTASSLGESVVLCFIKQYSSDLMLVSGWSSGTGFSGVVGSLLYLICSNFNIPNNIIFASLLPSAVIYILAFRFMIAPPPPYVKEGMVYYNKTYMLGDTDIKRRMEFHLDFITNCEEINSLAINVEKIPEKISPTSDSIDDYVISTEDQPLINQKTFNDSGFKRFSRVMKSIKFYVINLTIVYIAEYCIITSLAAKAIDDHQSGYIFQHFYELVQFCYQITVLISRSSLHFVQIKRIDVLTIFQIINFIIFIVQDYLRIIPVYVLLGIVLWTGLLGGSSYINSFHLLLSNKKMNQKDREYAINLAALFITIGIMMSSFLDLLLDFLYKYFHSGVIELFF
ncbi:hypothetical protein RCL1_004106 [Eukaryota sp. TZLM3-RCL]